MTAVGPAIGRLLTLGIALLAFVSTGAGWARGNPVAFRPSPIAAPAGAHPVGRVDAALTDLARDRTIMVSVWYPALEVGTPAAYVPAAGSAAQARIAAVSASWMHATAAAVRMVGAQAAATDGAPVAGDRLPVVIVSPGLACPRWILSSLAADLASRGWVAIVIDHTGESPAVQLPDGRIVWGAAPPVTPDYMRAQLATRVADSRLVLDRLPSLPIVGAHLDLDRVAMAGHSYGGTTAAHTMAVDPRVRAAVMIDSPAGWVDVTGPAATDRPVLALQLSDPWPAEWERQPRADGVRLTGAAHYSASDLCAFVDAPELCGTIDADRAAELTRGVIAAWLDTHARGVDASRYTAPEVVWRDEH